MSAETDVLSSHGYIYNGGYVRVLLPHGIYSPVQFHVRDIRSVEIVRVRVPNTNSGNMVNALVCLITLPGQEHLASMPAHPVYAFEELHMLAQAFLTLREGACGLPPVDYDISIRPDCWGNFNETYNCSVDWPTPAEEAAGV